MSRRAAPVPLWPPIAGFYATKLVKGGPRVAVRIWFGPAVIDGEIQDRGHDWRVEIDGRTDRVEVDRESGYRCRVALPVETAWPYCLNDTVDEAEYRFLLNHSRWAKEHAPDHPKASPRQPVDFNKLRLPF